MRCAVPRSSLCQVLAAVVLAACGGDRSGGDGDAGTVDGPGATGPESPTALELEFSDNGGNTLVARFDDPDGAGGAAPIITGVSLARGGQYGLGVRLYDRLAAPTLELTSSIRVAGTEHQVFFTAAPGDVLPFRFNYGDRDTAGLPVGLVGAAFVGTAGASVTVTLRHLASDGGTLKVAGLADVARDQGLGALPGVNDISVTLPITLVAP